MLMPSPSMAFIIQDEKESQTQSGIVIATDNKRKPGQGTIYSINATVVCPHCTQQFDRKDLAVGDKVLFSRYVAEQVEYDGDGLKGKVVYSVPLDSILAKIHEA
jgi:co-chaperonin GroES (HSP10)